MDLKPLIKNKEITIENYNLGQILPFETLKEKLQYSNGLKH